MRTDSLLPFLLSYKILLLFFRQDNMAIFYSARHQRDLQICKSSVAILIKIFVMKNIVILCKYLLILTYNWLIIVI